MLAREAVDLAKAQAPDNPAFLLRQWLESGRIELPEFLPDHLLSRVPDYEIPDLNSWYDDVQEIPFDRLYGDIWLFKRADQRAEDGRPHPGRLANCLCLRQFTPPPPVEVHELPDKRCIVADGAHRIYAAFLLGEDRIQARVTPCIL